MKTAEHYHHDTDANPHRLLVIELEMAVRKHDHDIDALNARCEYLVSHYRLLISECAALYKMHGLRYAVACLDADATHRLPESVLRDIRKALRAIA